MLWQEVLAPITNTDFYKQLWKQVEICYQTTTCFPPKSQIFRALQLTHFDDVKVVILGQDPYHNIDQANGLSFSVNQNIPLPPSLRNIFTELKDDLGITRENGDLQDWAKQGVLLLNTTLTVEAHQPNSHRRLGWGKVTDTIITEISHRKSNVVFVLWGASAQKKEKLIDSSKHFIIKSPHPSPLSVYRGFYGSKPFSKINDFLISNGFSAISW